jgi:hypothetical protein
MKGTFRFQEDYTYHMPVHFRGYPASLGKDPVHGDMFSITAEITTRMEALAPFVPGDFEILRPVVQLRYCDYREVSWMSDGEYRVLAFGVPVRYLGNDEGLAGVYPLVLWEDKTEPILYGRENTGIPKMHADISVERHWEDQWFLRASLDQDTFVKLDFRDGSPAGAAEIEARNLAGRRVNHFGWRYLPNVNGIGAALSHAVLYPFEFHIDTLVHGAARLAWPEYAWQQNINQAGIILGLSALPVLEIGAATRCRGRAVLLNSEARALP